MAMTAHTGTGSNESVLLRDDQGAIAILTLNRPKARNCLSEGLMDALQAELDAIAASESIKVVILAANGPVFSSGHDIKEMTARRSDPDGGKAYFAHVFRKCSRLMQTIVHCPKPVIAAVTGTATAAGAQLVASCDLAVAGTDSKFCTPGVHIGLFCSTPMVAISRNMGRKRAMEMLLLGDMIEAEDAAQYGLINRVVAPEKVPDEAMAMARKIAGKSAATVAIGKGIFYKQIEEPLGDAYDTAAETMVTNMMIADAEEGLSAFLEKRDPKWSDS